MKTTIEQAMDQVDAWMESPTLTVIGESDDYWPVLRSQLRAGQINGAKVHDARVAAICIGNGVSETLTTDRDFDRFPGLAKRNPLIVAEWAIAV